MDLTIGDKGSYAYINFGASGAHEDEARRAVKSTFDLKKETRDLGFLAPLQMGITQGTLRVGAYGGKTRQYLGALGDEVNLAARLMTGRRPGRDPGERTRLTKRWQPSFRLSRARRCR